jgi:hypothetical protein
LLPKNAQKKINPEETVSISFEFILTIQRPPAPLSAHAALSSGRFKTSAGRFKTSEGRFTHKKRRFTQICSHYGRNVVE